MKRCGSEHGYQMNEMSLEKSQIHDWYHFGIMRNVVSSVQRCCKWTWKCQETVNWRVLYIHARCRKTVEEVHWLHGVKHNPTYLITLSTKRNPTQITLSFKSFNFKMCLHVWFLSTVRDEFKRCNKIFLIQIAINIFLGIVNQVTSSSFCHQVYPESQAYRLYMFQITRKDKIAGPTLSYKLVGYLTVIPQGRKACISWFNHKNMTPY